MYLDSIEFAICQEVLKYANTEEGKNLVNHLPYLKVNERNFTERGFYVHFGYEGNTVSFIDNYNAHLGSTKSLKFDNFEEFFSFEIIIDKGKFKLIEVVTYEDGWDGTYKSFEFIN